MPYVTQTVEVEFDVSDLDEDELVDACRDLGYAVTKCGGGADPNQMTNDLDDLAEQYRNKHPQLMETLRTFLQNYGNRILP